MSEYRDEMRRVSKDVSWTIWRFLPIFLLVIVILTIIGWGLQSAGIIGKNIEREVVQHSRQFIESKQAKLQNLYTQYLDLQTKAIEAETVGATEVVKAVQAQQKAIIAQMRREATNIPTSEVPAEVQRLIY
jgi:uncharacterized membrane protein